jgi:hypothetical protein
MSAETTLTSGKPMSIILKFVIPLFIGNVFQQLYNMVDTIIVGHYVGTKALAAVGSTGTINFLVMGFAIGMTTGFTVVTAQKFGAEDENGVKRYDFQFQNKRGYKTTVEGLSEKFNKEYWNYAKLISGVLRYRMPVEQVIKLVDSLQFDNENINTWKVGVERALKKYTKDGPETEDANDDI